jgi:hypothetical protein
VSAFDRILDGVKQVLLITEEIKRLSEHVKILSIEVREIDRRLARIEGMVEAAKAQGAPRAVKRLPKPDD